MDTALFQGTLVKSKRILYTPSVFAKTNLIHLQEVGELQSLKPHRSQRGQLSSYLFFLVLEGHGSVCYGGKEYQLAPDSCAFIDCQKTYSHFSSDDLWKLKWVHFYGSNMNGIYNKYTQRGGQPCFHTKKAALYYDCIHGIHDLANSSDYIRDMKIFEKLTSLLTMIMEESWRQGSTSEKSARARRDLSPVKEYLDQHFYEKISLDELSQLFFINKFYLTRLFKEEYGLSIHNYLIHVRITHAKELLRFTDLSIEKIGQECGMDDGNYFSRVFRKVEGVSPGEFQRTWSR